jgi:hypothetical protein
MIVPDEAGAGQDDPPGLADVAVDHGWTIVVVGLGGLP